MLVLMRVSLDVDVLRQHQSSSISRRGFAQPTNMPITPIATTGRVPCHRRRSTPVAAGFATATVITVTSGAPTGLNPIGLGHTP